ncbi:MAG: YegS C-terminal kinase beta sandwich-like domain, partial [Pseudomonadota bacterium]
MTAESKKNFLAKSIILSGVLLDLIIMNRKNWWGITKIISSLSSGKSNTFLKGEYYQIKDAHIYSHKKMLVQVDGELIGETPVNVKIAPKA